MAALVIVVKNRLTNEDLEIEIDDNETVARVAEDLRKELGMPEHDAKGRLAYYLVHNGVKLMGEHTLRQANIKNQDLLTFYGEPAAAAGDREIRLQNEYDEVIARFRDHGYVKIKTMGWPPHTYVVSYTRLKGLVGIEGTQLRFKTEHQVKLTVPNDYPSEKLSVYMLTPAFHPNINQNHTADCGHTVCIGDSHSTEISVADTIARVGNYLQYRVIGMDRPFRQAPSTYVESFHGKAKPWPWDSVAFDELN